MTWDDLRSWAEWALRLNAALVVFGGLLARLFIVWIDWLEPPRREKMGRSS